MKPLALTLSILELGKNEITCIIRQQKNSCLIRYDKISRQCEIKGRSALARLLKTNNTQINKICNSMRPDILYPGFTLPIVIHDKKDAGIFKNKESIICLDQRNKEYSCNIIKGEKEEMPEIHGDGSYSPVMKQGGCACLIDHHDKNPRWTSLLMKEGSSNLMELCAILIGLTELANEKKIRIITDSLYVRKGITEWMLCWRLNRWQTASGEKAKFSAFWKYCDELLRGKYCEIQWIPGGSGNQLHNFCDIESRKAANSIIDKKAIEYNFTQSDSISSFFLSPVWNIYSHNNPGDKTHKMRKAQPIV